MACNDKKIMISSSVLKLLPSFSLAGSMKCASVISDPFFLLNQLSFLHSKTSKLIKHEVIDIKWHLHLLKEFQYSLCSFICHSDCGDFCRNFTLRRHHMMVTGNQDYNMQMLQNKVLTEATSGQNILPSIFFYYLLWTNEWMYKGCHKQLTVLGPFERGLKIGGLATIRKKFDGFWIVKPKDQS